MKQEPTELYRPREVSDLGLWNVGPLKFKVYGIVADGKTVSETERDDARSFVTEQVPSLVKAEGEDNGLGFIIIHSGDLGVSILEQVSFILKRLMESSKPTLQGAKCRAMWNIGQTSQRRRWA